MPQAEPFLLVDKVTKRFETDKHTSTLVVDDVSMTIAKGQLAVFLGPSGCGKTTLMRIIGGLETASAGAVWLEGQRVTGPDRKKGMVFQSYSSFPWLTVRENIRFGLKFRRDISEQEKERLADHYLELVGLTGFEDFHTNRISGGMRQRVAIARTLAAGPDVLLMDEPFGALDAQTRELLQLALNEIQETEHKTIVFVTHDVEEAIFLADRVFVFTARPATILEEWTIADFLPQHRDLDIKETPEFFRLRKKILASTRDQAIKTERMLIEN